MPDPAPSPSDATTRPVAPPRSAPAPLPYHCAVRDHFRDREPELWKWFLERETPDALRENVRLDLLKAAFRLERAQREELYQTVGDVAAELGLTAPITLYQAQGGEGMNAGLHFAPGEIHVVFQGPVLERLQPEEVRALLGHELTHYAFLTAAGGEFDATFAILGSLTQTSDTEFAHMVTARSFHLYTEILCDRGAAQVCGDVMPAIATLVKVETGMEQVSAESYVRQAEEIFAKSKGKIETEGSSHPETYIRARALTLFTEKGDAAEPEIAAMIEGARELDELDLLGQVQVATLTRRLIAAFLADRALQAEAHIAQAHLYFDDFAIAEQPEDWTDLCAELRCDDTALRDYYCYVLIDFIAADREVTDVGLVRGLIMFASLGWDDRLSELAAKELGLRKREMDKLSRQAASGATDGER